jgi:3-hydroxybutyryl-CoA dehydrogenase
MADILSGKEDKLEIKKVAIIGAGTMGHGIAQVAATAHYDVCLNDIKDEFLARAKSGIDGSLDRMLKKEKITAQEKEAILSRITFTTDIPKAVKDADLIIEAIPEILELKKEMFKKLDTLSKPEAILGTNTSQNSITEIASVVANPSRVVGTHFFNPPVMMRLVEVVKGLETADSVVEQIRAFATKLGKEIVVCKDSQGFISTRVLVALRLECYRILEEGIATKEDIDKTLKLALGHPMGQFELADFSGLDIEVPICEGLAKVYGERFRPPQSLVHLVKAGRLGKKSGRGWYNYRP